MATKEVEVALSPTALLARCAGLPGIFALDGGSQRSWESGHAVLGFRPRATLRIDADGTARMDDGRPHHWRGDPFELLDRFCAQWAPAATDCPEGAAVIAALSYDLRHWVERRPMLRHVDRTAPVLYAGFYDWLLWFSYRQRRFRLVSPRPSSALPVIAAEIETLAAAPAAQPVPLAAARVRTDFTKAQYRAAVKAALAYIAAGDIYQVNLAQRFVVQPPRPPAAVFAAMQQHAMPFGAYLDLGDLTLISNSPECLLTIRGDTLTTRPIKGTRPRGRDPRSDQSLMDELVRDPKEQAEHLMIVDLERNDLGRICRTGSVRVEDLAQIETFPSLHHLVSTITGQRRAGATLGEVLRAVFPGGSITGAPKVRAMEIIDELEPVARGFYTGAIGFVGFDDRAIFNLAIRTAIATSEQIAYHAGGGIVADSTADREFSETLLKARPFFTAVLGGSRS
ncbi:MAG: Aminodeoxychorismate synthase, subunit [Deltaproteobacteria bacterium]|nr:Aminodeoxychorismate synthase, subunit [Deltaproteobacteria bacterium]